MPGTTEPLINMGTIITALILAGIFGIWKITRKVFKKFIKKRVVVTSESEALDKKIEKVKSDFTDCYNNIGNAVGSLKVDMLEKMDSIKSDLSSQIQVIDEKVDKRAHENTLLFSAVTGLAKKVGCTEEADKLDSYMQKEFESRD